MVQLAVSLQSRSSLPTIRARVELGDPTALLCIFFAVGGHAFEGVEIGGGGRVAVLVDAEVVAEDGVQRSFVDAVPKGAEVADLDFLVFGQRLWLGGMVCLVMFQYVPLECSIELGSYC